MIGARQPRQLVAKSGAVLPGDIRISSRNDRARRNAIFVDFGNTVNRAARRPVHETRMERASRTIGRSRTTANGKVTPGTRAYLARRKPLIDPAHANTAPIGRRADHPVRWLSLEQKSGGRYGGKRIGSRHARLGPGTGRRRSGFRRCWCASDYFARLHAQRDRGTRDPTPDQARPDPANGRAELLGTPLRPRLNAR